MLNANDYIGRMIGDRYLIKKEIGHGASAMVFFAEDRLKGIHVAVKIIDKDDNEYMLNDNSFKTEIHALMEISSHANIVEIYDACFDGDDHYIVMEHVEGCTLRRYLDQNGILPEKTTVTLACQMLRALEHAHRSHIVHRDVKPQNIMVLTDKQGNLHIKLADFGIACLPDKDLLAMKDRGVGTVHYISPEQAGGYPVDARSDLYSLGVVLYEMATGHIPFEASNATAVLAKHQIEIPKPPRCYNQNLNPQLGAIIMKALEKDPHDRFKSADAMMRALDDMSEGRGMPTTVKRATVGATGAAGAAAIKASKQPRMPKVRKTYQTYEQPTSVPTEEPKPQPTAQPQSVPAPEQKQPKAPREKHPSKLSQTLASLFRKKEHEKKPKAPRAPRPVKEKKPHAPLSHNAKIAIFGGVGAACLVGLAVALILLIPTISGGNPNSDNAGIKVPNFVGMNYEQIQCPEGVELGKITYEHDGSVPEGSVISQTPNANILLNGVDSVSVDLVISKGPKMIDVTLTEVQRFTSANAETALRACLMADEEGSKLSIQIFPQEASAEEYLSDKPVGYVLYATLANGTRIDLANGQIPLDGSGSLMIYLYTNPEAPASTTP